MYRIPKKNVTKSDNKAAAATTCGQPKQPGKQAEQQAAVGQTNIASKPSDNFLVAKGRTQVTQQGVKRRSGGQSVVSDGAPCTTAQGRGEPESILALGRTMINLMNPHGDSGALRYVPSNNPVQRPVIGFKNSRFDCFVNTTVTTLLSISSFVAYVQKAGHGRVTSEIHRLLNNYISGRPVDSLDALRVLIPNTGNIVWTDNNQQCAHEFATCLLDTIEEEAKHAGADARFRNLLKFSYEFKAICPGRKLSDTTGCSYPTSLPAQVNQNIVVVYLQGSKTLNLQSGLMESLKYNSDEGPRGCKCNPTGQWTLQPFVSNAPDVLTISVARFRTSTKMHNSVEVPEHLSLPSFGEDIYYKLVAASVHHGNTMKQGHYTSIVKKSSEFFLVDDDKVSEMDKTSAENELKKAYIYFYVRLDAKDSPVKKKLKTDQSSASAMTNKVDKYLNTLVDGNNFSKFDKMSEEKTSMLSKLFNIPTDTDRKEKEERICEAVRAGLKAKVPDEDEYRKLLIQLKLKPKKDRMSIFKPTVGKKQAAQAAVESAKQLEGDEGQKQLGPATASKQSPLKKLQAKFAQAKIPGLHFKVDNVSPKSRRRKKRSTDSAMVKALQEADTPVKEASSSVGRPTAGDLEGLAMDLDRQMSLETGPSPDMVQSVTRQLALDTPMDVDHQDPVVDELSREMSKSLSVQAGVAVSMESLGDSTAEPKIKQSLLNFDSARDLLQTLDSMTRLDLVSQHSELMKTSQLVRQNDEWLKSSLRGAVTEWTIRELTYGERRRILTAHGVTPFSNNSKLMGQLKQAAMGEKGEQVLATIVEILSENQKNDDVNLEIPANLIDIYRTLENNKSRLPSLHMKLFGRQLDTRQNQDRAVAKIKKRVQELLVEKLSETAFKECQLLFNLDKPQRGKAGRKQLQNTLQKSSIIDVEEKFLSRFDTWSAPCPIVSDQHQEQSSGVVISLQTPSMDPPAEDPANVGDLSNPAGLIFTYEHFDSIKKAKDIKDKQQFDQVNMIFFTNVF